jgi:hypothetical protein
VAALIFAIPIIVVAVKLFMIASELNERKKLVKSKKSC